MMVDTSAIVAIARSETDAVELTRRIAGTAAAFTTTAVLFEASLVLSTQARTSVVAALEDVSILLERLGVSVKVLHESTVQAAAKAADRFGKGRGHPAQLNLLDCLSYGAARAAGVGLVYKGDDFSKTDLPVASGHG